jgi:maltose O-acetyltransferase
MLREILGFIRRNGLRSVLLHVLEVYVGALLRSLPGVEGLILRGAFYRALFARSGPSLLIYPKVYLMFSHKIAVGRRVAINVGTYIDAGGGLSIGDHVMIGPNCVISTRDHGMDPTAGPMCFQPVQYGAITIGDDVWFGANCFVRRGITIGNGAVIAAGTIVLSDVPPGCIFGGVPGRVLRQRGSADTLVPR